jgi:hypothetical protein
VACSNRPRPSSAAMFALVTHCIPAGTMTTPIAPAIRIVAMSSYCCCGRWGGSSAARHIRDVDGCGFRVAGVEGGDDVVVLATATRWHGDASADARDAARIGASVRLLLRPVGVARDHRTEGFKVGFVCRPRVDPELLLTAAQFCGRSRGVVGDENERGWRGPLVASVQSPLTRSLRLRVAGRQAPQPAAALRCGMRARSRLHSHAGPSW